MPSVYSTQHESQETNEGQNRTWRPGNHPLLNRLIDVGERDYDEEQERDYGW